MKANIKEKLEQVLVGKIRAEVRRWTKGMLTGEVRVSNFNIWTKEEELGKLGLYMIDDAREMGRLSFSANSTITIQDIDTLTQEEIDEVIEKAVKRVR